MRFFFGALVASILLSSCVSEPPPQMATRTEASFRSSWEKRRWIEKTAKTLRYGQGLRPSEKIEDLEKLTSTEIVRYFINDTRFGDTVLDFNLYFLGFRPTDLRDNKGRYSDFAIRYPSAVTAAQEAMKDGDYFRLLDEKQPVYALPLVDPVKSAQFPELSGEELRAHWFRHFIAIINQAVIEAEKGLPENKLAFCKSFIDNPVANIYSSIINAGGGANLGYHVTFVDPSRIIYVGYLYCLFPTAVVPDETVLDEIKRVRAGIEAITAEIKKLHPNNYSATKVSDIRTFDISAMQRPGTQVTSLSPLLYVTMVNNSTNMNRKRGAYMLKQYFCDDLTPLNVVVPTSHTTTTHGSEASCFACHYKLDPMSGFFRDIGRWGLNFAKDSEIVFDDGARVSKAEYVSQWKAPLGSSREWDVGYVRSTEFTSKNIYLENMSELFKLIREAPEVRRCIVKRMHEYVVSERQVVEPGYLDYLTNRFNQNAKVNSSLALKETMIDLVTSNAFIHPDPKSNECYDFAPGTIPSERPPCQVAYLLEQNCTTCHSGSSRSGRLELNSWVKLSDGTYNFLHTDRQGKQLPASVTFKLIEERMVSSQLSSRMPLNRYISSSDREQIVLWVRKMGGDQ